MNTSKYRFGEFVRLDGEEQELLITCLKTVSLPNGATSFMYQLSDEHGEQVREENNNTWFVERRLRKSSIPSVFKFEVLMHHLKNDLIQREDLD